MLTKEDKTLIQKMSVNQKVPGETIN